MKWRYRLFLGFFVFLFSLIFLRLFYWQVVRADELSLMGKAQSGRYLKLVPQRGEIKTSDNFPVVSNKLSYLVFANPKEIKDKKQTAEKLSPLLKTDTATISAFLSVDKYWVSLKNQINHKTKSEIAKLSLPGIGFSEYYSRFYPEASMAANLLGFVGKDEAGNDKGYFGLEGYYDRQLRGKTGYIRQVQDALGRPIVAKMGDGSGKVDGRSILLTIDRPVQFMMERELKAGLIKYGAQNVYAAALDPKTGGVIAMASFPSFDPANYQKYTDNLYKNPFISDVYEPGSTFKPLVMAAALDQNLLTPETKCPICSGPVDIGGYQIRTWNNKYTPNETMTKVIQHSDNTGMVYVSRLLGLDEMITYLRRFGFGSLTGIDLEGEIPSQIRPKNSWYPIDLATASFGQGISVTPIGLLSAFSALANSGVRMEPHVVSAIETATGEKIPIQPKNLGQVVSKRAATIMTEILINAVDKGEAKWAKPKGYSIAGKTGTAQIPVAGHYDPTKTIASFIGFAPAHDPKFVMLVIVDRPTTSIYGAETAAPIFFNIAKDMLMYYGIGPKQ